MTWKQQLGAWLVWGMMGAAGFAQEKVEVKLWPNVVPGEGKPLLAKVPNTQERVSDVTDPTITLYPAEKPNGCAVVICPGGGYQHLAWAKEGLEVAEWLNTLGVTAAVLKYRVPRRDPENPHAAPLQDAQRAMRVVRQHADEWKIDTNRVGLLGFSAGGHLAVMTGTHWDENTYEKVDEADALSTRPDFLIPIYAAYLHDLQDKTKLSPLVRVTPKTPPTFMAITWDDQDRAIYSALLLIALKQAKIPCELHVYSQGGHGYGLRPSDKPVSTWHHRCADWLKLSGFLEPKNK